jgi:transposase
MGRYDMTDKEWEAIKPHLPNKEYGFALSMTVVCERHLLDSALGSARVVFTRTLWPDDHDSRPLQRWRKADVWDRLVDAIVAAHNGQVQMIES